MTQHSLPSGPASTTWPSSGRCPTSRCDAPSASAAATVRLLGRESVEDEDGVLLPDTATQVGLRFVTGPAEKVGLSRPAHPRRLERLVPPPRRRVGAGAARSRRTVQARHDRRPCG